MGSVSIRKHGLLSRHSRGEQPIIQAGEIQVTWFNGESTPASQTDSSGKSRELSASLELLTLSIKYIDVGFGSSYLMLGP